jgi:polyhydroxyalkanoate synthesis regulator phasin
MFLDAKSGVMSPAWYLWFVNNAAAIGTDSTDASVAQSSMDYDAQSAITALRRSIQDIQTQLSMEMLYDSELIRLRRTIQDMRTELAMQCDYRAEIAGLRREISDIRTQFSVGG